MKALYKYFIFINDTVRGPFLPGYLWSAVSQPTTVTWYQLFTAPIGASTSLVTNLL